MIFDLNPSREYESNTSRLIYLSKQSDSLYQDLHTNLKFMRKMGLPTIGNPILKLENQVLTLVYSVMQHQINCELYSESVAENAGDEDLEAQLCGLYEMTNNLSLKYHDYLADWAILKEQEGKQLETFSGLSISA